MTATFNLVANVSTLVLASTQPEIVAGWRGSVAPALSVNDLTAVIEQIRERAYIVVDPITGQHGVATGGGLVDEKSAGAWPVIAVLPAMYPEWLGDRSFNEVHGTRFPYVTGAMANGIATTQLVIASSSALEAPTVGIPISGRSRNDRNPSDSTDRSHRGSVASTVVRQPAAGATS